MMLAKKSTPLDRARAAVVLSTIGTHGSPLGSSWYGTLDRLAIDRVAGDRALNDLAASGKIAIESYGDGVHARRLMDTKP